MQFSKLVQRISANCAFGPTEAQRVNVKLVEGDDVSYWLAQLRLLFNISNHSDQHDAHEFGFVQYFDLTPLMNKLDRILNCICLRWAANDEMDYFFDFIFSLSDFIEAGEGCSLVSFLSILSIHHIVKSNCYCPPFSLQLWSPVHRCFPKTFIYSC